MTLWNLEPSKWSFLVSVLLSPVHSARKFSTVFGTTFPYRPITSLPDGSPPIDTSKYTLWVKSMRPVFLGLEAPLGAASSSGRSSLDAVSDSWITVASFPEMLSLERAPSAGGVAGVEEYLSERPSNSTNVTAITALHRMDPIDLGTCLPLYLSLSGSSKSGWPITR